MPWTTQNGTAVAVPSSESRQFCKEDFPHPKQAIMMAKLLMNTNGYTFVPKTEM